MIKKAIVVTAVLASAARVALARSPEATPPPASKVQSAIANLQANGQMTTLVGWYDRNSDMGYLGDVLIAASDLVNYVNAKCRSGGTTGGGRDDECRRSVEALQRSLDGLRRSLPDSIENAVRAEAGEIVDFFTSRMDDIDGKIVANGAVADKHRSRLEDHEHRLELLESPSLPHEESPWLVKAAAGAGMVVLAVVLMVLGPASP